MSVIFEWCMSASIARSAFVELWHVGRDMDGLGGAEMLAQGAGMAPSRPRSTRTGCVQRHPHQAGLVSRTRRAATHGGERSSQRRRLDASSPVRSQLDAPVMHSRCEQPRMAGGCLLGQRAGRAAAARRGGAVSADTVDWAGINTVECRCRQTVACTSHAQSPASTFF